MCLLSVLCLANNNVFVCFKTKVDVLSKVVDKINELEIKNEELKTSINGYCTERLSGYYRIIIIINGERVCVPPEWCVNEYIYIF